jgi:hypothetical protein
MLAVVLESCFERTARASCSRTQNVRTRFWGQPSRAASLFGDAAHNAATLSAMWGQSLATPA